MTEFPPMLHISSISPAKRRWASFLALLALVIIVYCPIITGELVVDDSAWIVRQPSSVSTISIKSIFSSWGFAETTAKINGPPLYRPLGNLIQKVELRMFGSNPVAFHLSSLLQHFINSLLVYVLIGAVIPALPWLSRLLVASAFAVHPALTEAVAWISSVSELQMTTCVLGAMICYINWRSSSRRKWLIASVLLALAGIMIKEAALSLPLLILMYDWMRGRGIGWKAIALVSALSLLFLLGRHFVIGSTAGGMPLTYRPYRIMEFLLAHLRFLFLPAQQPFSISPPETPLVGRAALFSSLALFALLAWWSNRQASEIRRVAAFGASWILFALWPAYAIAMVNSGYFAGRHVYLASIGWVMILAAFISSIKVKLSAVTAVMVPLLLLMATLSFRAATDWQSDVKVFERCVEISPNSDKSWAALAKALHDAGQNERATKIFLALLERSPNLNWRCNYLYQLALISSKEGRFRQSNQYLEAITTLQPYAADAWIELGDSDRLIGNFDAAARHYERAVKIDPNDMRSARKLAEVLLITAAIPRQAP